MGDVTMGAVADGEVAAGMVIGGAVTGAAVAGGLVTGGWVVDAPADALAGGGADTTVASSHLPPLSTTFWPLTCPGCVSALYV
jgi:hypothetical protein